MLIKSESNSVCHSRQLPTGRSPHLGDLLAKRPPLSMRPRRRGQVVSPGHGERILLDHGVQAEWLVGHQTGSRNLTTGLITLNPMAKSIPLSHPHHASLTVLSGSVAVLTGDTRIDLHPLDNVVIQPGQAHAIENPRADRPAVLHASYPTATPRYAPARILHATPVFLTRHKEAMQYEASPGAMFIDHFGARNIPGIRMCGGLGTFAPGARLPAHVHDFDESICIITGEAVCWAEGERLIISDCSTALQPRGRSHYFVNETSLPMAMLWVYAGPTPRRMVVDERCATELNFAWPEGRT